MNKTRRNKLFKETIIVQISRINRLPWDLCIETWNQRCDIVLEIASYHCFKMSFSIVTYSDIVQFGFITKIVLNRVKSIQRSMPWKVFSFFVQIESQVQRRFIRKFACLCQIKCVVNDSSTGFYGYFLSNQLVIWILTRIKPHDFWLARCSHCPMSFYCIARDKSPETLCSQLKTRLHLRPK